MADAQRRGTPTKGRGAPSNASGRFESFTRESVYDGWDIEDGDLPPLRTTLTPDTSRSVISTNESPDIPFDASINPYRGCEHGCVYCYARPTHAWLGLSPGLDFESKLFFKPDAAERLKRELCKRGYHCTPIALGSNTDPYQPVERKLRVTRSILEVLSEARHPVRIVTKGALVERDIDLLSPMAKKNLCTVSVSVTTLDHELARRMEPRATAPARRLKIIHNLSREGIPVNVLVAPVIPVLNDSEIETILTKVREAGACSAGYVMLRLPLEIKDLFTEWLEQHYPLKARHVMSRIFDTRDGKAYDSTFGSRMRGTGEFADLIARRFALAVKRLQFPGDPQIDCSQFRPAIFETQLPLF